MWGELASHQPTVPVLKAGHPGGLNILCQSVKFCLSGLVVLGYWSVSGWLGCLSV